MATKDIFLVLRSWCIVTNC